MLKNIEYRLGDKACQVVYDIERNLYLVGYAFIGIDDRVALSCNEHTKEFFVRYLLMRGAQLYHAGDAEHGDALFRAAIDIGLTTGDPLPSHWLGRLNEARNEYIQR